PSFDPHAPRDGRRARKVVGVTGAALYSDPNTPRRRSREGLSGDFRVMTAILGLSAFYHDSAAALIVDGQIIAAAQEERFTRKKHDPAFPAEAIAYCLKEGGVKAEDLNYVAFYDKPLTKFDRLLE